MHPERLNHITWSLRSGCQMVILFLNVIHNIFNDCFYMLFGNNLEKQCKCICSLSTPRVIAGLLRKEPFIQCLFDLLFYFKGLPG